jgi:hypothetical protein
LSDAPGPEDRLKPALVDRIKLADGREGPVVRTTDRTTEAEVIARGAPPYRWSEEQIKWTG